MVDIEQCDVVTIDMSKPHLRLICLFLLVARSDENLRNYSREKKHIIIEHLESLLALVKAYIIDIWDERKSRLYGDVECAQQPRPQSPTGKIAGVNGQNSKGVCQGGKPGTGKLYTDVCLCCSAHTSGCVVDGLGATAAH